MSTAHKIGSSSDDINILLLGETGVGKSTFINALVNYLHYNTLDQALRQDLKILIPCSFVLADSATEEEHQITIGSADRNENPNVDGASSTQACRSYVFHIGGRRVRLIDGPGVGDTRGMQYERKNFDDILSYISQYEHLNGICILLKPSLTRLNIYFRYCVKELLRHLNRSAVRNIMFVFTNARATFYKPGETTPILRKLLAELHQQTGVQVPFDQSNTFMFDNEAFRFLAAHAKGIRFIMENQDSYDESWRRSVEQINRLMKKILECDLHPVRETRSLNEAQQLIRQLSRPIAETSRLILENIGMAEKYKQMILTGHSTSVDSRLPQRVGHYVALNKRLTVCVTPECTALIRIGDEVRVDYHKHCHDGCFLHNVVQECIGHPVLRGCAAMNPQGTCKNCGCDWTKHMHITYRYEKSVDYIELNDTNTSSTPQSIMNLIDQRISALRREEQAIRQICVRLSGFLKLNSITPFNDDLIEYFRQFLQEEKQKQSANVDNAALIRDLEQSIAAYGHEVELYQKSIANFDPDDIFRGDALDEIFRCVQELYDLPISGSSIKDQIQGIRRAQIAHNQHGDQSVSIPTDKDAVRVLSDLASLIASQRNVAEEVSYDELDPFA